MNESRHDMKRYVIGVTTAFLLAGSAQGELTERSAIRQVVIPADCVPPAWPEGSERFGEAPVIDLELLIDATGAVVKTRIARSSGSKKFDGAARVAFARCIYLPLTQAGKLVRGWARVHYQWILE